MINNIESYNKAQLIELAKTHIEGYQKLERNLGLIKLGNEQQHKQLISCETALDQRNDKVSLQASRIAELEKERDALLNVTNQIKCIAFDVNLTDHDTMVTKLLSVLNSNLDVVSNKTSKSVAKLLEAHNLEQQISAVKQLISSVGVCQGPESVGCYLDYDMVIDELNKLEQAKQLREGVKND